MKRSDIHKLNLVAKNDLQSFTPAKVAVTINNSKPSIAIDTVRKSMLMFINFGNGELNSRLWVLSCNWEASLYQKARKRVESSKFLNQGKL